jgi:diadenosine tetraphosphate (Ap4A) HIT family hydrolase
MGFTLDPRLAADTFPVASWRHCEVRLMDDARWPWAILVPRVPTDVVELHDLPDPSGVMGEVLAVSRLIGAWPGVEKVNVGALGNVVRQLHVHVVGRRPGDPAWPGPVWGHGARAPYGPGEAEALIGRIAGVGRAVRD